MANIVISGDSSGSVTLSAPAVSGTTVLTLPTTSGTLVVTGGAQTIEFADGTVSAPSITNSGDTNTGIYFPAADTIAFTEGGVESMRIDSAGNLGVGTSSPQSTYKLTISGTDTIFPAVYFENTTNSKAYSIRASGTNFAIRDNTAGNDRITLDTSGRVGIGTTSPSQLLTVSGGSNPAINITNTAGPQSNFYCTTTTGVIGTGTNHAFEFHTNNTEQARISANGFFQFNSGYGSVVPAYGCRAWVNFFGDSTPGIRASGNVSSITDNGTGDYTINFTTAFPNTNYSYVCSGSVNDGTPNNLVLLVGGYRAVSPTTSALRILTAYITSGAYVSLDAGIVNVAVFR